MAKKRETKIEPMGQWVKTQEKGRAAKRGLPEEFTRATFIIREDYFEKLKDVAYTDRVTMKDLMEKVLGEYIKNNVDTRTDVLSRNKSTEGTDTL